MPDPALAVPASPFASILSWSATWPDWQRDALRRIVVSGPLNAESLKELAALCRAKHGLLPETGIAPTAVPLTATDTPGGADGSASVSLTKLSGLRNVNRIPSDQEIIFGTAPGLTVIYGENGAGKSGYARVIKKACRARGTPQEIKPDAFSAGAAGPAKASIAFRAGAAELPFDWRDGVASDPHLGNIFVFDSFSARYHVGEDGPACFKPRGLDVLPELAKACDAISVELKKEIDATSTECANTAAGWKYSTSTAVGKLITTIGEGTKPESIDAAAVFTEVDDARLTELIATLSDDPKKKSAETSARAKRIRTFAHTAKSRATSVGDTAMQNLGDAIQDAETTAAAAKVATKPDLKASDLPGSCSDVWRKLWDAAKAYSVGHAYPEKAFPVTEADAKCVLCQQTLQPDAIDRYARFNKFVTDETRNKADAAKAKVAELKMVVDPLHAIGTEAYGIKADLEREAAGTFAAVEAFANAVDARIAHAQKCLKEETWTDAPALPASPCAELVMLADTLDNRATDELAAAEPEKAKALAAERDELTDKKWLAGDKDDVKAQIARRKHASKLKDCQADCVKNTITLKSGELEKTYVTKKFHNAFKEELKELGMTHARVQLEEARPEPGIRRHGLRLEGSPRKPNGDSVHNPRDVLSEGEQRCAALAAFMAELSQASHKSALVFDDPVSSLDHIRRDAIATRLMKEAAQRQVIVFTHNLAFVCDLERAAGDAKKDFAYRQVEWVGDRPGRILPHLAWQYKSDEQQINEIKSLIANAVRIKKGQGETEYREAAQVVITRLRGACERLVEQTLLCGAVKRHDSQMFVSRTPGIAAVTKAHWTAVHDVWKACSNTTDGHAAPFSGPKPVPTPSEFTTWVTAIERVIEEVTVARKPSTQAVVAETRATAAPVRHS